MFVVKVLKNGFETWSMSHHMQRFRCNDTFMKQHNGLILFIMLIVLVFLRYYVRPILLICGHVNNVLPCVLGVSNGNILVAIGYGNGYWRVLLRLLSLLPSCL